jgi:hypothetical protein
MSHYEGNVHINMCLILNGYRDRAVWIYKYKTIVNCNKLLAVNFVLILMFKWRIWNVEMTNLL